VPEPKDVIAIIPTFHPGDGLVASAERILAQTSGLVIVDDGTGADASALLAECRELGAITVAEPENLGIAHALNVGIARAREAFDSCGFILTLDQDSLLPEGYVTATREAFTAAVADDVAVGMVAPERIGDLPPVRAIRQGNTLIGGEPIQSGLLIPIETFDTAGTFREDLFIDGVDTEFYVRCLGAGLEVVVAPGTHVPHRLGEREQIRVLGMGVKLRGRPITIVRSSLFRYYYLARNRALINRQYGRTNRAWAIKETLLDVRHYLIVLIFLRERRTRLRLLRAGWRDGKRGRGGKMPSTL
jgi:rhamnosyltransferase